MNSRQIILVLDNIRSLYNVGAIFRTADAVAVQKIYLCGITGTPKSEAGWAQTARIHKTALGAEENVSWEYSAKTVDAISKLKKEGWQIVILERAPQAQNIFELVFRPKVALIVGHEREGIGDTVLALADQIAEIPMQGKKESLNVAVAAGIALYVSRMK